MHCHWTRLELIWNALVHFAPHGRRSADLLHRVGHRQGRFLRIRLAMKMVTDLSAITHSSRLLLFLAPALWSTGLGFQAMSWKVWHVPRQHRGQPISPRRHIYVDCATRKTDSIDHYLFDHYLYRSRGVLSRTLGQQSHVLRFQPRSTTRQLVSASRLESVSLTVRC